SAGALPTTEGEDDPTLGSALSATPKLRVHGKVDLTAIFFRLNSGKCKGDGTIGPIKPGEKVRFPSISEETFIDSKRIKLDGTTAVSAAKEQLVYSNALANWASISQLAKMNPLLDPKQLESDTKGQVRVPI